MPTKRELLARRQESVFTARENEVGFFSSLLQMAEPPFSLIVVTGLGGIGKSSLLHEFRRLCRERQVPCALVDCAVRRTIVEVLQDIRAQLNDRECGIPTRNYDAEVKRYLRIQSQLRKEGVLPDSVLRMLAKGIVLGAGALPFAGTVVEVIGTENIQAAMRSIRDRLPGAEADFYLNPEQILTERLLKDINAQAAKRPVVLMFDTYEMASLLDTWLREAFFAHLEACALLVLASRQPLAEGWHPWRSLTKSLELPSFSPAEARQYLWLRGIRDDSLVDDIVEFAGGLPLALSLAADLVIERGTVDFAAAPERQDVIGRLIRMMVRDLIQDLRLVLEICSILRYFNEDVLRFMSKLENVGEIYDRLSGLSFVLRHPAGLALHERVRELIGDDLQLRSPARYREFHAQAASYYARQLSGGQCGEWQELQRERLYHLLRADEEEGVRFFRDLFDQGYGLSQVGLCETLVSEATALVLREDHRRWVRLYQARLAWLKNDWRLAEKIYAEVLECEELDPVIRTTATRGLGDVQMAYGNIRKALERYEDALQQAAQQGWLRAQGHLHSSIGLAYRKIADYERALEHLERAYALAVEGGDRWGQSSSLHNIGIVHRKQGRLFDAFQYYRQALDIAREEKDERGLGWMLSGLGTLEAECGNYERAIDLCNKGIGHHLKAHHEHGAAYCTYTLASVLLKAGRLNEAEERLLDSLGRLRQLGDELGTARAMVRLATLYARLDRTDVARQYGLQALESSVRTGDLEAQGMALLALAQIALSCQDDDEAYRYSQQAEELARRFGFWDLLADAWLLYGHLALRQGQIQQAAQRYVEALASGLRFNVFKMDAILEAILHQVRQVPGEAMELLQAIENDWRQARPDGDSLQELEARARAGSPTSMGAASLLERLDAERDSLPDG